jgi:hypothetical protein
VTVGGVQRIKAEAASWTCDQTQDFRKSPLRGKAWTELEGGGLLQRVNQWTQPLQSPFRQYNDTLTGVIGYFPAEQARGSKELVSTIPGTTQQGAFTGAAFESQHRPAGSAPLMDVDDGAGMGFYFAGKDNATSTAGWQLSWVARFDTLPSATGSTIMYWLTGDGTAYGLTLNSATGGIELDASRGGVTIIADSTSYSGYDWTQWTLFSLDASYSGGTTTIAINWTNEQATAGGFTTSSFAGVPASLKWWSVLGGDGEIPPGSTIGHIMAVSNSSGGGANLFNAARREAWTGYLNEAAALRFIRLCNLFGLAYIVSASYLSSTPMGPQPVATLAEHFREIATTDDALIFDDRTEIRLRMLCRLDRYNLTPTVALVPADLPALPREVVDDQAVHNLITASQRDGGEAIAEDSTGPLGTQPPPNGVGEYRQDVAVNLAAPGDRLPQVANWWLRRGTVNLPRFPQVTINLNQLAPARIAQIEVIDVGHVITISGYREDLIRLQVIGYTETIGTHSRTITFVCVPDQQFDVARYVATGATPTAVMKRYDSRTSTLSTGYAAGAVSMVVTFTDIRDAWSTVSAPYDWAIAGERITVTAMGAITGSGPWTQTATVTRAVNGVSKAQVSGASVRMHPEQQARYAL